jgi:hypothetical protein
LGQRRCVDSKLLEDDSTLITEFPNHDGDSYVGDSGGPSGILGVLNGGSASSKGRDEDTTVAPYLDWIHAEKNDPLLSSETSTSNEP